MKRIRIFTLVLCACFVSAAWAQQLATKPPLVRHVQQRMANRLSKAGRMAQPGTYLAQAIAGDKSKTWDLGVYPGGTWAELHGITPSSMAASGKWNGFPRLLTLCTTKRSPSIIRAKL